MEFKTISTSVTLKASIGLNCRLCQSNPASTIEWFLNGKPLQFQGQRMHITSTPCQETLFLLVISGEDEGDYTCVARNRFGETNSTTKVRIIGNSHIHRVIASCCHRLMIHDRISNEIFLNFTVDNGCSSECILANNGKRKVGNKAIGEKLQPEYQTARIITANHYGITTRRSLKNCCKIVSFKISTFVHFRMLYLASKHCYHI